MKHTLELLADARCVLLACAMLGLAVCQVERQCWIHAAVTALTALGFLGDGLLRGRRLRQLRVELDRFEDAVDELRVLKFRPRQPESRGQ